MDVIIIGGGQVGAYIAHLLLDNKYSVKIIENRETAIEKLKKDLPEECVIHGNGTDPNFLESVGIESTDVVVAVTGADETNIVASTIAKFEFAVPRVIARVNNPKNAWMFNSSMGVDVGLNQADLMGHLVIEGMALKHIMTLLKLNHGDYSIIQVNTVSRSRAVGKAIRDLAIPSNAVLIAITRKNETLLPRGDTVISAGDAILAIADHKSQEEINELFGN